MIWKTPLSWLQLTREKTRLLVALSGIGFANVLMFVQLGFLNALFDSAVRIHASLKGDVFLISPQSVALISMKQFSERRLYQVMGFEGVESVSPLYLDFAQWKNHQTRTTRNIFVIGFNPDERVFNLPDFQQNADKLKTPDTVLFDEGSRAEFGPVSADFHQGKPITTEVANRKITVEGLFKIGPSFGADGNLITSDLNFLRLFSTRRTKGLIDVGMIKLKPGVNSEKLIENMRIFLPEDVKVISKQEFMDFEISYWNSSTPTGFIFTLGAAMGFIVGTVIVYQILYSDVSDHLAEYATLKAMGYTDAYLLVVVFQEALILAILGYIPGVNISLLVYAGASSATLIPIVMSGGRAMLVLALTVLMCFVSGAIAVRKLRAADPADIF
jgi:putative ABC transport system permease protein